MRVVKYIPEKLYGFCHSDQHHFEAFFHMASFQPGGPVEVARCSACPGSPHCQLTDDPPAPILGEVVDVECEQGSTGGRAPRASRVERVTTPRMILGVVESFDPQRRYGFAMGDDQVSYHLHESEIIGGRLPLAGNRVVFFAGLREGRPRACHVKVCR